MPNLIYEKCNEFVVTFLYEVSDVGEQPEVVLFAGLECECVDDLLLQVTQRAATLERVICGHEATRLRTRPENIQQIVWKIILQLEWISLSKLSIMSDYCVGIPHLILILYY